MSRTARKRAVESQTDRANCWRAGAKLIDHPIDLGASILDALVEDVKDPSQIEDVIFGCLSQELSFVNSTICLLLKSFPWRAPCSLRQSLVVTASRADLFVTLSLRVSGRLHRNQKTIACVGAGGFSFLAGIYQHRYSPD